MQTTDDRADYPAGTAVSGRSTADSSGITGPFTVCDALMRERDALVYHRQMLKRKRTEIEQDLKKQRCEKEVCPALFVFPSAEDMLRAAEFDRVQSTFTTHGIAHQCVHNSAVLSSWSTPIGSGVGATGLTDYQKPFHAHSLPRTLQHIEKLYLCFTNQVAVMHALPTTHTDPMLRRFELDVPEVTEAMIQCISKLETDAQLDYLAIRVHRVTPTLKILCNLSSLRSLDLSYAANTNEDLSGLQGCQNLIKLDLSHFRCVTYLPPISQMKTLEVVKFSRCRQLVGVGALGRLPRLRELDLSHTRITDEAIHLLSACHTLVKIDLHSCKALMNVNPLSSIATLEVINLSICTSLTHVGELGRLPALKEVNLGRTPITDKGIRQLSECHTLVKINLYSCKALGDVDSLSSIATLEVINLSGSFNVTRVAALGKLPKLKCLNLCLTGVSTMEVNSLTSSREQLRLPSIDISGAENTFSEEYYYMQ